MICYRCHEEIPDQSNFCNLCGVKQEFFCQSCGHLLVVGSIFCNQCGTKLVETSNVLEQVKAQGKTSYYGESKLSAQGVSCEVEEVEHPEEQEAHHTQPVDESVKETKQENPTFDLKNHLRQRMQESRNHSLFPESKESSEKVDKKEESLVEQAAAGKKRREEEKEGLGRYRETPVEKFIFSNSVLLGMKDKSVKNVVIPSFVTSISHHAFRDCTAINEVMLPDSIEIIGKEAFIGCSNLRMITLSKALRIIGNGTFMGCESLSMIKIPESVVTIGDMAFYGCKSLLHVEVENKKARIGSYAFSGCPWVETLE